MSFVPVVIPIRCLRQADVSAAVVHRGQIGYLDFRFSRKILKALHWARYQRIAPFYDASASLLMFSGAASGNPAARALMYQGGQQLSARWAHAGPFAALIPPAGCRTELPVVSAADGQLIVDVSSMRVPQPATSPTIREVNPVQASDDWRLTHAHNPDLVPTSTHEKAV